MRDEAQIRSDLTAIAAAEKAMATNPDWQITTKHGLIIWRLRAHWQLMA
jgi:hypothetical protein